MDIDYEVVSESAGHTKNKGVDLKEAARDIFKKCKEKAMQCAVNAEFITFDNVDELMDKLKRASVGGCSIRVYDEVYSG